MAYVSQEMKAKIAPQVKKICTRYGVKGTLSVRNHSTLVLKIKSGKIDFFGNHNAVLASRWKTSPAREKSMSVNVYHIDSNFTGTAQEFLLKIRDAMRGPDYYDNTDIQADYFDTSHYIDINIGEYDKDYQYIAV